MSQPLKLITHL